MGKKQQDSPDALTLDELAVKFRKINTYGIAASRIPIADMATYPWICRYPVLDVVLDDYPHVKRWFEDLGWRPATIRAYENGAAINTTPTITEESKMILLGQDAKVAAAYTTHHIK